MVDKIEVRGAIPAEVIQAAQVLMKWSEERFAAVKASSDGGDPDTRLFSMNSLAAPDGSLLVVCGPEHAHCLEDWFERHRKGPDAEHDIETSIDNDETHGPSA